METGKGPETNNANIQRNANKLAWREEKGRKRNNWSLRIIIDNIFLFYLVENIFLLEY